MAIARGNFSGMSIEELLPHDYNHRVFKTKDGKMFSPLAKLRRLSKLALKIAFSTNYTRSLAGMKHSRAKFAFYS